MKSKFSKPVITGAVLCGAILSYLTIKEPIIDDGIVGKSTHYTLDHRVWNGPGWYDNYYYPTQADYNMYVNREGGFYKDWDGPGWYDGMWFKDEGAYNSYLYNQGYQKYVGY